MACRRAADGLTAMVGFAAAAAEEGGTINLGTGTNKVINVSGVTRTIRPAAIPAHPERGMPWPATTPSNS